MDGENMRYLETLYDLAGGRTTEEVWSGLIAERVGITEHEDLSVGHQIRYRLRDAGLVSLNQPLSSGVVLTEAGKEEVERRRGS